jgi:prevent-host-death family protein
MRSVDIVELKNNLSRYLREVRAGEELLIRDHDQPIAKIIPLTDADDLEAHVAALAATGKARLPEAALPHQFWSEARAKTSLKRLIGTVSADRDEED